MHVPGGHREQRRQRRQRDARNRGVVVAVVVVVSRCSRSLAASYSLSASSTSVTQPCSTCMLSTTSDSGRKATLYIGGNVRVCKKAGGNVRGATSGKAKCSGRMSVFQIIRLKTISVLPVASDKYGRMRNFFKLLYHDMSCNITQQLIQTN